MFELIKAIYIAVMLIFVVSGNETIADSEEEQVVAEELEQSEEATEDCGEENSDIEYMEFEKYAFEISEMITDEIIVLYDETATHLLEERYFDEDWLEYANTRFKELLLLEKKLRDIDPPKGLEEAHVKLAKEIGMLGEYGLMWIESLEEMNSTGIELFGNSMIEQFNVAKEALEELQDELQNELETFLSN